MSRWTWVSQYQNVSILDFIGTKVDGGGGDSDIIIITILLKNVDMHYIFHPSHIRISITTSLPASSSVVQTTILYS